MSWEEAPVEVISQILSYLDQLQDRQSSSLVCQKWYQAYQAPTLKDMEKVTITKLDHFKQLLTIPNKDYKIRNLKIESTGLVTRKSFPFWTRYGSFIQCLEISTCRVSDEYFVQIMSQCLHLKTLSLVGCRLSVEFFSVYKCQRLLSSCSHPIQHLQFIDNVEITNSMFYKLLYATPNLKTLNLSLGSDVLELDVFRNSHPTKYKCLLSSKSINFDNFYQRLSTVKCIVDLSFKKSILTRDHLKLICNVPTLKLNSLNLSHCEGLLLECLMALPDKHTSLTHLNLSSCSKWVTDECLKWIGTIRSLKILNLEGCDITDKGIVKLDKLDLVSLSIYNCQQITGEGLWKALTKNPKSNLRTLEMGYLSLATETHFINIFRNTPNLRYLDLNFSSKGVSDRTLQNIILNCPQLEVLLIRYCTAITDRGITGNLFDTVWFENTSNHRRYNLRPVAKHGGVNLKTLKNLKQLDLRNCNIITDESLIFSFEFSGLIELDLSCCVKITNKGLKHVTKKNPSIERLKLISCCKVNDVAVFHIMKNLKHLKTFWLGSSLVSNVIITYFAEYGCNLRDLDIMYCFRVDSEVAEELTFKLPKLKRYLYPDQPMGLCNRPTFLNMPEYY